MSTPEANPEKHGRRKLGLGALIGALGLTASILALSVGAGAQTDSPQLVEPLTEPDLAGLVIEDDFEDAFDAYNVCIESELGLDDLSDTDIESITDEQHDAAYTACEGELPEEVREANAAYEAYDACLVENGVDFGDFEEEFEGQFEDDLDDHSEYPPSVSVITDDAMSFAEFGEGDGTVTITKVGDSVTVETTGDVTVEEYDFEDDFEDDFDFDPELEAAFATCEGLLSDEDGFFGGIGIEPMLEDLDT